MRELDNIFKIAKLINDFQKIERVVYVNQNSRSENDVEHCYQLAMVGWYLASSYKLNLDIDLVIKYGMIHDLVEVYAGDTYIFDKNPDVHASKVEREHAALQQIKEEFPEFSEMTDIIENYEKREDEESKFIYALDKVIAPVNIYLDGGKLWKVKKVTFEEMLENKTSKVKAHPEVEKYFNQLVEILEKEKDSLFHKN